LDKEKRHENNEAYSYPSLDNNICALFVLSSFKFQPKLLFAPFNQSMKLTSTKTQIK
jgi:hypothetical protein